MRWQQLILRVAADRVSGVEALLESAGANAVSLGDAADVPVLEPAPGETPLWPEVVVTALFPADVDLSALQTLLASAVGASVTVEPLTDDRWQGAGFDAPAPRRFGRRLWLAPADGDVPDSNETSCVRLHMGHAFGTGAHPTTALCLEWIEAALQPGGSVLDFGCGSGVLALAAIALGAQSAWATDNDAEALTAARRNAALNGAGERLWIGPPEALPDLRCDVVLANILARPLIERADWFADRLVAGGRIVLSGVLDRQRDEVVAAYERRFEDFSVAERDGWLRIAARRR